MGYIVAVDSGGTFTDCVVLDESGRITTAKATSTPPDYSEGILNSVALAAQRLGMETRALLGESILFGHGTTVATNTLLTRTGSRIGCLTTAGHEDALIIGRTMQKVAGLSESEMTQVARLNKPNPLVPRSLIHGVHERTDCQGDVVVPLNRERTRESVHELLKAGVEGIAVCLLWSFKNPSNERVVREILRQEAPDIFVTLSSDLAPVMGEYERGATTVMNAYLAKRTGEYLDRMRKRLAESGFCRTALVMQSSGGVSSIDDVRSRAVGLLTSGPAGGVIGAKFLGDLLGHQNIISTDVGGTSFDVGLVINGEPQIAERPVFFQFQILFPIIDVATIGAGGGSIARVDPASGILQVGPQSAGADPGPACYATGGEEPTVTDANLVLGRLNPDYFLGGARRLDPDRAVRAVERVARPLGLSIEEAAMGIIDIVDSHMADLIRKVTIERGSDPRQFFLYAFGGAGPVHVGGFGRGLGVREVVIPSFASEFSALGIAGSDLISVQELADPLTIPLDPVHVSEIYRVLEGRAREQLADNGVEEQDMQFQRYMKLRYRGQVHEVRTPVPLNGDGGAILSERAMEEIVSRFEVLYEERYGKGAGYRKAGIQAITYHVYGYGRILRPKLEKLPL
ncbi:MAG: hydantoinase/oxoprolinase family protein, partial [Nitrospinota bacterium]